MTWDKLYSELIKPNFWQVIEDMKENGTLEKELPEVFALIDTPERETYHGEKTTYNHTILVLKQVTEISHPNYKEKELAKLNFCALCHDLGKALTPKDILPKHIGHEVMGLTVIRDLCKRIGAPIEFENFATLCCQYHMNFLRVSEMRAVKVLRFVKEVTDNFTNYDNLSTLILLCYCDSNGRICNEENKTRHEDNYNKCFDICLETFHLIRVMNKHQEKYKDFICHKVGPDYLASWENFQVRKLHELLKELDFDIKGKIHFDLK